MLHPCSGSSDSGPVESFDDSAIFEAPDLYPEEGRVAPSGSSNLIEAHLVDDPRSAIHVAVELEPEPPRKRWKTIMIIVVAVLVLVGAVVGGVVGSQDNSEEVVQPKNVLTACPNATSLELGNIVNATIGINETIPTDIEHCGMAERVPDALGVWYNFELGENNNATGVSISTCTGNSSLDGNFDSQMLVFTGPCNQLRCLDGNDNLQQQGCFSEAGVKFIAYPSMEYHILVYGRQPGTTGDFAVQASTAIVPPSNNDCNHPDNLNLKNSQPIDATLVDADPPSSNVQDCSSALNYTMPGVWFFYETDVHIEEYSDELIITTCSPANSLGLIINVFSGECDGLLVCNTVTRITDYGEGSLNCDGDGVANSIRFFLQAQSNYLILVQNNVAADVGEFSILARIVSPSGSSAIRAPKPTLWVLSSMFFLVTVMDYWFAIQ